MKKYSVARPYIDSNDIAAVTDVLKSGHLSLGPKYSEFERKIAEYAGVKYSCAVSSGTAGLHLAVKSLGLSAGDEVITSPFSFISSSNCLLYERVKPVFVDIEELTYNMDPLLIEKAINKRTKAILIVHMFGQSAQMDEIMAIARKYKLKIIEDACESIGATFRGKMAGTFGNVGVYAFYPNKQMTTGEGGIIVTNNKKIYQLCDSLRNQGRNNKSDWLAHIRLGYNYRLDEMSAVLGISQLSKLDWIIREKRKIVSLYNKYLNKIPGIILPQIGKLRTHTWFVYCIRIIKGNRDEIMKKLSYSGIQTKSYMPVIHLQPFMKKLFGFKKGDFPVAEKIASQTIALPFYIGLNESDVKKIVSTVRKIVNYNGKKK